MNRFAVRVLGPLSFVLLGLAAACGSGGVTTSLGLAGLRDAGLGGVGYDATTGVPGDDGSIGSSSGMPVGSSSGDDGNGASSSGPASDDGSPLGNGPPPAMSDDDGGEAGGPSGSSGSSSGTGSSGGGIMCVPSCATDLDCQNSCPTVVGGHNCCDVSSATCFASQTQCPGANDAAPE